MSSCKALIRTSTLLFSFKSGFRINRHAAVMLPIRVFQSFSYGSQGIVAGFGDKLFGVLSRRFASLEGAISVEPVGFTDDESTETSPRDIVEHLLNSKEDAARWMKMERRSDVGDAVRPERWFPYLDRFNCGESYLNSGEILKAIEPYILDVRKERFRNVVRNRSYSLCLVVEGLCDLGNVSAAFRSADALGVQSVHVVSYDSKRYRENRYVGVGAEKWLDIDIWDTPQVCFQALKSRGYRIATTHVGIDAVSIYDMDWSIPTAIVVGNENSGISDEALKLSDLHCSIPMNGMVDSFNVSVAAGILMHHAVCDRTARLGNHGDLTNDERQILLAEFFLRHSKSALSIAHEYAKKKAFNSTALTSSCRRCYSAAAVEH